jgi:hypothetical protein
LDAENIRAIIYSGCSIDPIVIGKKIWDIRYPAMSIWFIPKFTYGK